MGEVALRRPEFEAVVKFNPTDQQIRLRKVPSRARKNNPRRCRQGTDQFFSWLIKNGTRIRVEISVRMAEKARGETSRRAILAKG